MNALKEKGCGANDPIDVTDGDEFCINDKGVSNYFLYLRCANHLYFL